MPKVTDSAAPSTTARSVNSARESLAAT
jgi:hypothetical protein